MPRDDSLHQGIRTSSWRNADLIVGQRGECAVEVLFIDVAQGLHESVVLTITHRTTFKLLTIDFHLDVCTRFQTVGCCDDIANQFHLVFRAVMFQDIADNIRQVVLCHDFLLVAQLRDALCHPSCLLRRQFQTQFLKVLGNVGTTALLTQCVLTLTAKTLRNQLVIVQLVLCVAISMYASHLGKHILTNDRLVGGNANTTKTLDHS